MSLSFRGTRAGSLYAAVLVAISSGMVWLMSGQPDSTAKNWLMLAWILLTAMITAFWLVPSPVPRAVTLVLTGAAIAVPVVAWLAGVQDNILVMPFFALALGFLGAMTSPRRMAPGSPQE